MKERFEFVQEVFMNFASTIWGKKVIEKAMEYANYKWK